jgi:hypothetical protein
MVIVSLTSNRMPAMRFDACHIRTPRPREIGQSSWSVFVAGPDRKTAP